MMNTSQYHWFSLDIQHQYFERDICPVFKLIPVGSTQRLMKNYAIRFQKQGNQYNGYVAMSTTKKVWEELPAQDDLFFMLINTDPYFANYTEVPLSPQQEKVTYITNVVTDNRFHEKETITPTTYLAIQGLRFNVAVTPKQAVTVSIKNNQGKEIFNQTTQEKQQNVAVDISALGTGVYQLWIDGILSNTFIGSSEVNSSSCYGIVHLQMNTILESLKENTQPSLKVNFLARATYWQYIIMTPKEKKITIQDMSIEGIEDTSYTVPEKTTLIAGKEATMLTSQRMIKLRQKTKEHSILKIQYTNDFSDTLLELDIKIPIPTPSSIITKKENDENVYYSQTIIYV